MVISLNLKTNRALGRQMERRQVHKTYIALAFGVFEQPSGTIDAPIAETKKKDDPSFVS